MTSLKRQSEKPIPEVACTVTKDHMETPAGPLLLQSEPSLPESQSYSVKDLLRYHDRLFVENVYRAITRRQASDVELNRTLDELRSGRRTKIEIIEEITASHGAGTRLRGLQSRTLRKLAAWPLIGYVLRITRAVIKLPIIMQDQQRFEVYAMAQQQRIADYLNEHLTTKASAPDGQLPTEIADATAAVIMLSDSLVELAEKQRISEETLESLTRGLTSLQKQLETSESQLHANLVQLTGTIQSLQQQVQTDIRDNVIAQREFLVQEQDLIVAAQKLALKNLEARLTATIEGQRVEWQVLSSAVEEMRLRVEQGSPSLPASTPAEVEKK